MKGSNSTNHFPGNRNSREFIKELAKQTRLLRDKVIMKALEKEEKEETDDYNTVNHIRGFHIAYKMCVTRDISKEEFAEMYAQTVTFGLFYAALLCRGGLERKKAMAFYTRGRRCQPPTHAEHRCGYVGNWHCLFPNPAIFMAVSHVASHARRRRKWYMEHGTWPTIVGA